jgi:hypothetical protein
MKDIPQPGHVVPVRGKRSFGRQRRRWNSNRQVKNRNIDCEDLWQLELAENHTQYIKGVEPLCLPLENLLVINILWN